MTAVRVAVTGAGSLFGQGIIKCLRQAATPVDLLGLDYFEQAVGLRWCDRSALLPDLLADDVSEDAWLAALVGELRAHGSRLLFVGADFELLPLARHAASIAGSGVHVLVSPPEVVQVCKDKHATASWLRDHGFPAPMTLLPAAGEHEIEQALGFPLVVKPRFGSRSRGVTVVRDGPALARALVEVAEPCAQQYLPDDEAEFSCGVMVLDGEIDSVVVLRRRLRDGNTVDAHSGDWPEIERLCADVARALGPSGPVNIQLRLHRGTPHIFEINPRFSGTTVFRAMLGVNEPERLLRHSLGLGLEPAPRPARGRVLRYFDELLEFTDG